MKEFLIFKNTNLVKDSKLNAWAKLSTSGKMMSVDGEILNGNGNLNGYSTYLKLHNELFFLGENSKFQKEFAFDENLDGFIILIIKTSDFTPVLYCNYKSCCDFLEVAEEVKSFKFYNDETIATENYFKGENYETERIYNDDNYGRFEDKESPPKISPSSQTLLYEELDNQNGGDFYRSVERKFNEIVYSHPKDNELSKIISGGEFCKIFYDSERYYSVGRVLENGKVKYLCYAVKGSKDGAPKELLNYSKFLPLSPFEQNYGYYVIFQNAIDGKVIT